MSRNIMGVQVTLVGIAVMVWASEAIEASSAFVFGILLVLAGTALVGQATLRER